MSLIPDTQEVRQEDHKTLSEKYQKQKGKNVAQVECLSSNPSTLPEKKALGFFIHLCGEPYDNSVHVCNVQW
jgi:hypothetical protein